MQLLVGGDSTKHGIFEAQFAFAVQMKQGISHDIMGNCRIGSVHFHFSTSMAVWTEYEPELK